MTRLPRAEKYIHNPHEILDISWDQENDLEAELPGLRHLKDNRQRLYDEPSDDDN